jgi:hypothetical protein
MLYRKYMLYIKAYMNCICIVIIAATVEMFRMLTVLFWVVTLWTCRQTPAFQVNILSPSSALMSAFQRNLLSASSRLKVETVCFSETLVSIYEST